LVGFVVVDVMNCLIVIIVIVRERVLSVRAFWYCKIFSWVRRSTLQLGAQGGERKREKKREICKLRAQIELYVLYNIKKHSSVDVALGRG
jgi:hypothetical protein